MEPTLFRFIWRRNKKGQLVVFLLTMLALPFYYISLELPKIIINGVLGAQTGDFPFDISAFGRSLVEVDRIDWLVVLCVAFLLAVTAQGGVKFVLNVYKGRLGGEQLLHLRREICEQVLQLPPESFEQLSSDEISTMIGTELSEVGGFVGEAFATPLLQGGLLITAILFIFIQDAWLGLAAIALFPVQGYVIPRLQKRVNTLNRNRIFAMRALAARLREATDALPEIQAAGNNEVELTAIEKTLIRIYDIRYAIFWRRSFIKLLNSFLFQLTPFLFLLIGGYFVLIDDLTLGALVAVLAAYKDLPPPARELLDYYQSLQNVRVQYEQVVTQFELPDFEDRYSDDSAIVSRRDGRGGVEVEALKLSVKGSTALLEHLSFSTVQGEAVAILGLTELEGSALARALVGLERPTQGNVRIGGVASSSLSPADRQGIMLIGGRGALFSDTLRNNLLYGQPDPTASPEREFESMAVVQLSGDLPYLGLNTVLDIAAHEQAAVQILKARYKVRTRLDSEGLIEPFDAGSLCRHTSIAENIVWGKPLNSEVKLDDLCEHPAARQAIRRAGLDEPLLALGLEIGRALSDVETVRQSVRERSENLIFPDERALVHAALIKTDAHGPPRPASSERRLLQSVAMRVVPAQYSKLHVDGGFEKKVLAARRFFARALSREAHNHIDFFDPDCYVDGLTVRENLLFGVVKSTRSQSVARLESRLLELVDEFGLADIIAGAGLEYQVGLRGSRLTPAQRQKLQLARLIVCNPDLGVIYDGTSHIDKRNESKIVSDLVGAQRGRSLIWILNRPSLARHFDSVLLFEKGKLIAQGSYSDLNRPGKPLHTPSTN